MGEEKWKTYLHTIMHNCIYGEWHADKGNGLHVHTLESVLNAMA